MIRTLTLSLFGLLLSVTAFADGGARDYEVTITNITQAQIFAPVAVATHNSHFSLFTPGAAALPELATLAESGNPGPLLELLDGMPGYVLDTNHSGGVLLPGDSVTVMISGSNHYDRLSLAAMLVSSNDAFAGLSSMALPKRWSATMVSAFDKATFTSVTASAATVIWIQWYTTGITPWPVWLYAACVEPPSQD